MFVMTGIVLVTFGLLAVLASSNWDKLTNSCPPGKTKLGAFFLGSRRWEWDRLPVTGTTLADVQEGLMISRFRGWALLFSVVALPILIWSKSQKEIAPAVPAADASRTLADSIADDLVAARASDIRLKMMKGFREASTEGPVRRPSRAVT